MGGNRASRRGMVFGNGPDEGIGFGRDDPCGRVIETDAALGFLWKWHRIGGVRRRRVRDGKDQNGDGAIDRLDGEGEHESGAILPTLLLAAQVFVRPKVGVANDRPRLGYAARQRLEISASASISARKCSGVSAAENAC